MAWNPNVPTVTNRVQDDLNAIRENFQHLDQSRIVEMGSNINGTYVRWENGLQVCWHQSLTERITNTGLGPLYRSDFETWTFPAGFVGNPVVMIRARRNPPPGATGELRTNIGIYTAGGVSSTSITGIAVLGVNTLNGGYLSWFAIGRWK